eukprot:CAMPEP_0172368504 /NCGR_PEP_ID=MMETSP1060-20121228/27581_1 /TAXON_ID=37318 /ORGANISM="Pseudo-nitzschia pungens, Strain cf. cingulata" /LENGTH=520 /DNA_ID=CAMNT_0013093115 /DNA_START=66 /DNA_END=1628 /DNA_ORIENTATION=-
MAERSTNLLNSRRRRFVLTASVVAAVSLLTTPSSCVVMALNNALVPATKLSLSSAAGIQNVCCSNWRSSNESRCPFRLYASSGEDHRNRNLSNSERGRREEDRQRKERKDDVVIGKTSAKRGAQDYPIDPKATEREYLRQASREEQLVHKYTDEGMEALKSLRLEEADKYFDKVFRVRPDTYLWLAGIVKFYLDDMVGASSIFAKSAMHFEKKFGPMGMGPASEERIWRNAAELKYLQSLKRSDRKQFLLDKEKNKNNLSIAQIREDDENSHEMGSETRKIHRLARELFDASVNRKKAAEAVARAHLLSFAESESNSSTNSRPVLMDIKKRKLNACYFLALHYDVTGDVEESKKWIKTAFKLCNNSMGKSSDILDTLPFLHMAARDWFDDDPYDEDGEEDEVLVGYDVENDKDTDELDNVSSSTVNDKNRVSTETDGKSTNSNSSKGRKGKSSSNHMSEAYSDPVLEASIMEDVEKMKFVEIREALRIRGISVTGSKETLKERLFISLMDDAGYQSGFAP